MTEPEYILEIAKKVAALTADRDAWKAKAERYAFRNLQLVEASKAYMSKYGPGYSTTDSLAYDNLRGVLDAIAALQEDTPSEPTCHWNRVEDNDDGLWSTSCGEEWYFTEGDPSDGGYTYCPKCGRRIDFHALQEDTP